MVHFNISDAHFQLNICIPELKKGLFAECLNRATQFILSKTSFSQPDGI